MLQVKANTSVSKFVILPKTRSSSRLYKEVRKGDLLEIPLIETYPPDGDGSKSARTNENLVLECTVHDDGTGFFSSKRIVIERPPEFVKEQLNFQDHCYFVLHISKILRNDEEDIIYNNQYQEAVTNEQADTKIYNTIECSSCNAVISEAEASFCPKCGHNLQFDSGLDS